MMRLFSTAILLLGIPSLLSGGTYLGAVGIQPVSPTTSDVITAVVSGLMPDTCHAAPTATVTIVSQNVTVDLSSNAPAGVACAFVMSPFTTSVGIGRLASGSYTIAYRLTLDGRFVEAATQSIVVAGASCTYSLSASGASFQAAGGTGSIGVTTSSGCAWTVSGLPGWVLNLNATSGTGSATVAYQVGQNLGGSRSVTLSVAGVAYTLEQAGTSTGFNVVGSMAQIASGDQWTTTITLINEGTAAATARLNFFDDNGNPLVLPLIFPQAAQTQAPVQASMIDRTVNPGAALLIQSVGGGSPARVGWAQLLANGELGGFAVFSAQPWEAVVPVDVGTAGSYLLYFDNTNGAATGVALANPTVQTVAVSVTLRDDSGAPLGSNTITIPAMGHTSFSMADRYSATAQKRGTLEVKTPSTGQVTALGLRFSAGGAFSTVPVLAK